MMNALYVVFKLTVIVVCWIAMIFLLLAACSFFLTVASIVLAIMCVAAVVKTFFDMSR